jgi:hypothetical protein
MRREKGRDVCFPLNPPLPSESHGGQTVVQPLLHGNCQNTQAHKCIANSDHSLGHPTTWDQQPWRRTYGRHGSESPFRTGGGFLFHSQHEPIEGLGFDVLEFWRLHPPGALQN